MCPVMLRTALKGRKNVLLKHFYGRKVKGMSIGKLIIILFCGLLMAVLGLSMLGLLCALVLSGRISRWEEEDRQRDSS